MARNIHRVMQHSIDDDERLTPVLPKSKEDDVTPSPPIAADMQRIETMSDIRPSPDADGSWTPAQGHREPREEYPRMHLLAPRRSDRPSSEKSLGYLRWRAQRDEPSSAVSTAALSQR